jgi:nuclear transport factor 2 (NTF2) superfamily protein
MQTIIKTLGAVASLTLFISTGHAALPNPGIQILKGRTALVVTDPQNDFLSPQGVTWGVVGKNVEANNTVENIDTLFMTAKAKGIPVFISPRYYYPHDHGWKFEGALEKLMHDIGMFNRKDPLQTDGFQGSGADWLERYKPYINDGHTTVTSPHKVYGPETNDLVLQLRKQGIDKVVLAGMSANLCTESHMRELLEQGFEVAVVSDATAETAAQKVRLAEDAWNGRDPEKVALAYTLDSRWRNRAEFIAGREAIMQFLQRKWAREPDYRLIKELWAFTDNRIAMRFAYEWHDGSGHWFRSYGNENWEFDDSGLMQIRIASINDLPIRESQRLYHWPSGRRPDGHQELNELGL